MIRPPAWGTAVPSDDAYFYHVTSLERAYEIAEDGLNTHRPWWGTDQDAWPDGSTERRSYWSSLAQAVWSFAPEEGHAVILRARRDAARFRREGTGDFYLQKRLAPQHLEIVDNEGRWHPISVLLRKDAS